MDRQMDRWMHDGQMDGCPPDTPSLHLSSSQGSQLQHLRNSAKYRLKAVTTFRLPGYLP